MRKRKNRTSCKGQAVGVIALRGYVELELRNAINNEVVRRQQFNTVATTGRRFVLEQIESVDLDTDRTISHIAIGTDTAAPATDDTTLSTESTRNAIGTFTTSALTGPTPSWRAEVSFATNEGNTTLGECGLFNSSADGTMLARSTFATIDKTTSNTLSISYTISN